MKMLLKIILFTLITTGKTHANKTSTDFGDNDRSIKNFISFPDIRGDSAATISCSGIIKKNGKLNNSGCYIKKPGDEVYVIEINKAAKKSRFIPATHNGKSLITYFQYLVHFIQQGESKEIYFYPNPGYKENIEAYGIEHFAAQRSIGKENWQKLCPRHQRFTVWVKAHVNEIGQQSNVSLTKGSGLQISEKCRKAIEETINSSIFIPANYKGVTVPSTYIEPFGN